MLENLNHNYLFKMNDNKNKKRGGNHSRHRKSGERARVLKWIRICEFLSLVFICIAVKDPVIKRERLGSN
jgi:hypothetical protein